MAIELDLGDMIRVRIACYTPNQVGINVVHFQVVSKTGTGQTQLQVAQAFDVSLAPRYKAVLSASAKYRGVSVGRVHPGPPTAPDVTVANDGVGLVAGDLAPTQVSGLISAKTDLAGVRYRGRAYIPFPSENDNEATSLPSAAYVTAIDDIGDELYTTFPVGVGANTIVLDPIVFHRDSNSGTAITSYIARTSWATQRRRGSLGQRNPTPF